MMNSLILQVNDTAALHCGFYSENGGFIFSNEDRKYMDDCKVVVSTCAFGGGDDLYQPIGMSEASLKKVIIYKSSIPYRQRKPLI